MDSSASLFITRSAEMTAGRLGAFCWRWMVLRYPVGRSVRDKLGVGCLAVELG